MLPILAYCASLLSGYVAKSVYTVIFGLVNIIVPRSVFLPHSRIRKYYIRFYLHTFWVSSEFVFALVTILVLKALGQSFPGLIVYFLLLPPCFVFVSTKMGFSENLFYFDPTGENPPTDFRATNRIQAISGFIGVFICLFMFYSMEP